MACGKVPKTEASAPVKDPITPTTKGEALPFVVVLVLVLVLVLVPPELHAVTSAASESSVRKLIFLRPKARNPIIRVSFAEYWWLLKLI
jgi:hypothetical protein